AFSVSDYAELVHIFIKKIGILNPIVIGHSFGGRIGIKFASTFPDVLERLVLTGSAGIIVEENQNTLKKTIAKIVKPLFAPSFMQPLRRKILERIGADDHLARPDLKD